MAAAGVAAPQTAAEDDEAWLYGGNTTILCILAILWFSILNESALASIWQLQFVNKSRSKMSNHFKKVKKMPCSSVSQQNICKM